MGRVFISHARRDRHVARAVADGLREHGHDPYVDDGPAAGADWWRGTLEEIDRAEVFLALLSPAYDGSEACRLEAAHAESVGVAVVGVPVDGDTVARAEGALAPLADEPFDEPFDEPAPDPEPEPEPEPEPVADEPRHTLGEAAAAAVMLVVLLVVVLVVVRSTGSDPQPVSADGSAVRLSALQAQVARADGGDPATPLPSSSCGVRDASRLICSRPAPDVQSVTLRSYADAQLLQEAYLREVQRLSGQSYRANSGACDGSLAQGEQGWSDRGTAGAAGRAFCVVSSQVIQLVWTQGDHLLGVVSGQPASVVAAWWADARVDLARAAD